MADLKVGDKVKHYATGRVVMEVVNITGTKTECKMPLGQVFTYEAWQLVKVSL